jgi:Fe-S-cluster-containing dehydrogenase component
MPRWGMVIDLDRCTACQACTAACRAENNVPFAGPEEAARGRAMFWNEVIPVIEGGYPEVRATFIPMPCMQCDNAPCIKVCPVGATYRNPEGVVLQDYDRCIGCRLCMLACPYNRRYFNWYVPQWPEPMTRYLNPDPEPRPRPKGVVEKCTFCIQRLNRLKRDLEEGKAPQAVMVKLANRLERGKPPADKVWSEAVDILMRRHLANEADGDLDPREAGYLPACVQTCPGFARVFGDLDDPDSLVSRLARSRRAFRLQEELGTQPKVFYLKEGEWG